MTPDEANLRCLEASVKNLIARLCRHDGSVLRDPLFDSTISGDLYATVASVVHNCWDHHTLSDLQRRYPLPKPIDAAKAGNDGGGELRDVRGEVSDGGGSAEHRGVCGQADVEPPVDAEWDPDAPAYYTNGEITEMLEQARSTTRRNIIAMLETGLVPPLTPSEDMVVADAARRLAKIDLPQYDRDVEELERQLLDATSRIAAMEHAEDKRELVLRDAIKSRDGIIKAERAKVDRLARHIAFQVAK